MADVHSPKTRSFNMSRIHGKNTKPEEKVRKYLFSKGFRYRKNDKKLPGTPDIVLPKYHSVVFVNGCFWHMHKDCKYFVWPKSNVDFWRDKLIANVNRDYKQHRQLQELGWNVIVVWECELKKDKFSDTMQRVVSSIRNNVRPAE